MRARWCHLFHVLKINAHRGLALVAAVDFIEIKLAVAKNILNLHAKVREDKHTYQNQHAHRHDGKRSEIRHTKQKYKNNSRNQQYFNQQVDRRCLLFYRRFRIRFVHKFSPFLRCRINAAYPLPTAQTRCHGTGHSKARRHIID